MDKVIKIAFIGIVILLIPLFWYLLSPLFLDDIVNEEAPTDSGSNNDNNIQQPDEEIEFNTMTMASFSGVDSFHKVSGNAIILETNDQKILRLEDFESTNGPDLFVYLSSDTKATDFVSLGVLKGNKGNQNYDIPEGTDLEKYPHVLIYCKQFGFLFGSAEIK